MRQIIRILALAACMFTPYLAHAQPGWKSNGAYNKVSAGAYVKINGGGIQLEPASRLSVNGTMQVSGDLFAVATEAGSASIIDKGTLSIDGTAQIGQYLPANSTSANWRYVSPPVSNATAAVFSPETSGNFLYYWDETAGGYQQITSNTTALHSLEGYAVGSGTGRLVTYTGSLHTGNYSQALTRTATHGFAGFHLVGNPYPSAIDWSSPNWVLSGVVATIWYRTGGTFATYNKSTDVGVNGGQAIIPPMQAFWVYVPDGQSEGSYAVNNDLRTHSTQSLYKTAHPQRDVFRLEAAQDEMQSEIALVLMENATTGVDEYDSHAFPGKAEAPGIYTEAEGEYLVIHSLPVSEAPPAVPLFVQPRQEGSYTLRFPHEGVSCEGIYAELKHLASGKTFVLEKGGAITLNAHSTSAPETFLLTLRQKATAAAPAADTPPFAWQQGNTLHFQLASHGQAEKIAVYNSLGQKIWVRTLRAPHATYSLSPGWQTGVYHLVLYTPDGRYSQKLLWK